jgi:hypothetical protein
MFYIEMDETTKFTSHVCHELFKAIFYIEMEKLQSLHHMCVMSILRPYFTLK